MPHLRLEYSANVKEEIDPKDLFTACHQVLVDIAGADLLRCQSRAFCCDLFHVGAGSAQEAFIYLEVLLLEGRSFAQLEEVGGQMSKVLERYFSRSFEELKVQIAVRITELVKSYYFKIESF